MQKYDSYKDSGIEWIGDIPSHWEVCSLLTMLRGKITDGPHETPRVQSNGIPFVSVDSVNETESLDFSIVKKFISEEDYLQYSKKAVLEEGDILFTKAASIGKTAIVGKEKFMVWSPLAIIKPSTECSQKFIYHVLSSSRYIEYISINGTCSTQINVGMRTLEKSRLPLPTKSEQDSIASYLDSRCIEINNLISTQEKRIELLNELKRSVITRAVTRGINPNVNWKNSGIEWIGDIPDHWDFVPLKRVAHVILGKMLQSDSLHDSDSLEKYICAKDVHFDGIDTNDLKLMYFSPIEKKLYQVKKGDMLIVEGGAGAGGCSVVSDDIQDTYIQNSIMIIRGNIDCLDNRYVCNFFTSIAKRGYIDMVTNVATIPHFSKEKVQSTIIPLPPIEEQMEIADYLYKKVSKIEKTIEVASHRIKLLKEYKQSLITEVVTGKRKVV